MARIKIGNIKGKDGNGIASTVITYAASENGITPPSDWQSEIPEVAQGSYLWTRTVITYTDDTTSTSYTKSYQGQNSVSVVELYGVRIDTTDSNPETCCEYTDNAVGMLPASGNNGAFNGGDWLTRYPFNQIKPCLFKNGAVVGYLNPNNFAQFEDGSTADISSGSAGDVMIEIPKFYYKIARNGKYLDVKISNALMAGFTDYAFSYKGEVKDKFYIGAYLGYKDSGGKLRSLTGKTVTSSITIGAARTAAQANGTGYEQLSFNKLTALQVLYIIMFKNLNSQAALGRGYTNNSTAYRDTGATDTKGMTYGTNAGATADDTVKFLGIEDFYGNLNQWVDGYITGGGGIKIADGNFNDTGNGYENFPNISISITGSYFKEVVGTNELAFTPKLYGASETTYFCDRTFMMTGSVYLPYFGGSRSSGAYAGAFCFACSYSASSAYVYVGARLCFCG